MATENNLSERAGIRIDSFQGVHKGNFVHSQPPLNPNVSQIRMMIAQDFVLYGSFVKKWCSYSYTRRNNQRLGCGILQLSRMAMQSQNFHTKQKTSEGMRQFVKHSG